MRSMCRVLIKKTRFQCTTKTVNLLSFAVCPSVAYIANNLRTQRPSVRKFGRKVPHLRRDSHTSFKVKRSNVRVRNGRGHTVSAEPGCHTACSPVPLYDGAAGIVITRTCVCLCICVRLHTR